MSKSTRRFWLFLVPLWAMFMMAGTASAEITWQHYTQQRTFTINGNASDSVRSAGTAALGFGGSSFLRNNLLIAVIPSRFLFPGQAYWVFLNPFRVVVSPA